MYERISTIPNTDDTMVVACRVATNFGVEHLIECCGSASEILNAIWLGISESMDEDDAEQYVLEEFNCLIGCTC